MATLELVSFDCSVTRGLSGTMQVYFDGVVTGTLALNCSGPQPQTLTGSKSFISNQTMYLFVPGQSLCVGPLVQTTMAGQGNQSWTGPGFGGQISMVFKVV